MTKDCWDDLDYWDSKEWVAVQEKLDDLDRRGVEYNPSRERIFAALDAVSMHRVKVAIFGQDPYPSKAYATGLAYSIPKTDFNFPPTLHNIFLEYCSDLKYPYPSSGNLDEWVKQGVLLWNVIPTCERGKSLSHNWEEWKPLTKEIINSIAGVMVFMGGVAREFVSDIPFNRLADVIETSHPSPRGASAGRNPFLGSRLFSTINDKLIEPINWRLS